jgi:hypothetical protein
MGLLRDENGYVLVLRKPQVMILGEVADEALAKPQAVRELPPATVRTAAPHCCFYCSWCGEPILLQHDRMGSPFGFPNARKIDVRSVATVCFACKHIGSFSMFRGCRSFDTRHKILQSQISGETILLNWLRCGEKTCAATVPLFVRLDPEKTVDENEAAGWLWDELTCALGHRIHQIPLDPAFQLPVRGYPGPR